MTCPKCKSDNVFVIDTRAFENTTRRRRKCIDCGERWSTLELPLTEYKHLQSVIRKTKDTLLQMQTELVIRLGEMTND